MQGKEQHPPIRDAEYEVMRALWDAGEPLPLAQLRAQLAARRGWEDSTTKTLLRRLQAKGAVKLVRRGVYAACLNEDAYNQEAARGMVDRLFGGSAKQLVAALLSDGQLTRQDIAELTGMFHAEKGDRDE